MNNFLSLKKPSFLIVIFILGMAFNQCKKPGADPVPPNPAPVINSFNLDSVSMTSASLSFSVANASLTKISLDGGTAEVATGGKHTFTGLTAGKAYKATLVASASDGRSVNRSVDFITASSSLKIDSFKVSQITESGASFAFATSGNSALTERTLTNLITGQSVNVLAIGNYNATGLTSSTDYKFALSVKDQSGNAKADTVAFRTLDKKSTWFKRPEVEYANPFAIVGGAISNKLTLKFTNTSAGAKTLPSLKANFGDYGVAVKMLRYRVAGGRWIVLAPTGANGEIEFKNLPLASGLNTIEAYFSIKPGSGVSNGVGLFFKFTGLDDGEGGKLPSDGSFQNEVIVGQVDANTQASAILPNPGIFVVTLAGSIGRPPNSQSYGQSSMFSFGFKMTGPARAVVGGIKLKNPFAPFAGLDYAPILYWDNNPMNGSPYETFTSFLWGDGKKTIDVDFPDLDYRAIVSDGVKANQYNLIISFRNLSSTWFDSENYTPGEHGFILESKYDIRILNSSGQVLDISDIKVYKNNQVYLTD